MKLPKQSVIYLGVCSFGLIIYLAFGIIPHLRAVSAYEGRISAAKNKLESHRLSSPLLREMEKRRVDKRIETLPFPVRGALPRGDISGLRSSLKALAEKNRMIQVKSDQDLSLLAKGEKVIGVVAEIQGELADFRRYLIALSGLDYLGPIEEIEIRQTEAGLLFRLRFKVNVG